LPGGIIMLPIVNMTVTLYSDRGYGPIWPPISGRMLPNGNMRRSGGPSWQIAVPVRRAGVRAIALYCAST